MSNRTPSPPARPCPIPPFAALVVLAWAGASPLAGQATVVAMNRRGETLDSTAEVLRTPFASVKREPVKIGAALAVDDELRSESDQVVVELRCPNGARVLLSGAFRSLIQPARPDASCVFRLSSGAVDVQSDSATNVDFAEATLGSRRTQYNVRIEGRTESPYRVLVYEGEVTVRTVAGDTQPVTTGRAVAMRNGRLTAAEMSPRDLERTARSFAQMDVAQARLGSDSALPVISRLARQYSAVLSAPAEPAPKVQLAATQLQLGVAPTASLYHLRRATPTDRASRATVGYLTGVAYSRTGDTAGANSQFRTAALTDSAAVEQVIRNYRLEAATYRAILRARPTMIRRDSTPGEPPLRRE